LVREHEPRRGDLRYFGGKLLRIDVRKLPYSIPPYNPFLHVKNARPEIWAYGFRKLWHFAFDPQTGLLFGGDVGQDRRKKLTSLKREPTMDGR
jgi:glucose/arabinose dehydrogenase